MAPLVSTLSSQLVSSSQFDGQFVVVFLRGGMDGLHAVMPTGDASYTTLRPNLSASAAEGTPLNDYFTLHAGLQALYPLYESGDLAIVHASGSPDNSHSHFDAQDYMEHGTPGDKSTTDGWLARALVQTGQTETLSAVALGSTVPEVLRNAALSPISMKSLAAFSLLNTAVTYEQTLTALYATDTTLSSTADSTFATIRQLQALISNSAQYPGAENYPDSEFATQLKDVATLLKADVGVKAVNLDVSGWDSHENEESMLASNFQVLAEGLAAFYTDLGTLTQDTTVVVMTEFGRRAYENASGGTDHGHGSCMFVLGGGIQGGQILGEWPGLADHQLHGPGDLAITTDYRSVLSTLLTYRHGLSDVSAIFPEFTPEHITELMGGQ